MPISEDPEEWTYSEHILLDSNSTIGSAAIGDIDGDGTP